MPPTPTEKRSDGKTQLPTLIRKTTALAVLERVDLLAESNALAFDIGGSLAKILYLQPYGRKRRNPRLIIDYVDPSASSFRSALSIDVPELRGTLHFFAIETRNIEACVQFIQANWKSTDADRPRVVRATGGGAYKYRELFRGIGVELNVRDEMACTVAGLNFLLTHVEHEVFSCPIESHSQVGSPNPSIQRRYRDARPDPFPYLLCHIGSGVSFIKVTGFGEYERVSGSSLGGGTFWGLCRILTNCKTFDEVIALTRHGDNSRVDMLVGDIYGGAYERLGLDANVIASSFGKVTMRKEPPPTWANFRRELRRFVIGCLSLLLNLLAALPLLNRFMRWTGLERRAHGTLSNVYFSRHFHAEDVALSALRMIGFNIAQLAYLNAVLHQVPRIYFGGSFVREHPYTVAAISYAVAFWSKRSMQALFLMHDGYLGALGSFLGLDAAHGEQAERLFTADLVGDVASSSSSQDKEAAVASTRSRNASGAVNEARPGRRGRHPRAGNCSGRDAVNGEMRSRRQGGSGESA